VACNAFVADEAFRDIADCGSFDEEVSPDLPCVFYSSESIFLSHEVVHSDEQE
jgi:hypothetical protein